MTTYTSTGTIRCCVGIGTFRVAFVTDESHTVNHMGKKYAVFLGEVDPENELVRKALGDGVRSGEVELDADNFDERSGLIDAAKSSCRIDVIIDENWKLLGFGLPAKPIETAR